VAEFESESNNMQRKPDSSAPRVPPVKEGEECEVTIEAVGRKGDGIAKIQGFVIFVPSVNPGDHVKIRITMVKPNFARGEVVSPTEAA
jgi:predicted RNA-binding protein with TRAM domain